MQRLLYTITRLRALLDALYSQINWYPQHYQILKSVDNLRQNGLHRFLPLLISFTLGGYRNRSIYRELHEL
jgi:hypothetical protein